MFKLPMHIIAILSLIIISCSFFQKFDGPEKKLFSNSTDKYRLVWNGDPTSSITIGWDQKTGENPIVYYGESDFGKNWKKYPYSLKPSRKIVGYRGMNSHFALLTGLLPNRAYYFLVKDSQGISERMWFKTAPDSPEPVTLVVGGDTKSIDEPLKAGRFSNQMVAKLRPLFVVYNGDFTSGDGTNDEYWRQWFSDWENLTKTSDGRMIPIVPVHGNHENGDKTVLNKLFNAPYQNNNPENIYYSLSFGGNFFHFIALNSEIEEGGAQSAWLEADLKKHQHYQFKMAGYHKPFRPHTKGKSNNDYQTEQWANLFYEYGLDISSDGDSHMSKITFPVKPVNDPEDSIGFVRDDIHGTIYIGEGSWGATPRPNNDNKPWTMRSGSFNQIKWLQVFPEKNGKPAHIDIRTVITSTRDDNDIAISQVENVEALTEKDVFKIPANIKLFSTPTTGSVVTYPFINKEQ